MQSSHHSIKRLILSHFVTVPLNISVGLYNCSKYESKFANTSSSKQCLTCWSPSPIASRSKMSMSNKDASACSYSNRTSCGKYLRNSSWRKRNQDDLILSTTCVASKESGVIAIHSSSATTRAVKFSINLRARYGSTYSKIMPPSVS